MTISLAQGVSLLYNKELVAGSNVTFDVTPTTITINASGGGGGFTPTFETVSKNLGANPASLSYIGDRLSTMVYTVPAGTITKTFGYTGDKLTSIVLSGDTPGGIDLTKTLSYTGDQLTGFSYS